MASQNIRRQSLSGLTISFIKMSIKAIIYSKFDPQEGRTIEKTPSGSMQSNERRSEDRSSGT